MTKWIVFAVASLGWIAVCWFFGGMVAVTEAVPRSTIAQQECAYRLEREGRAPDYATAHASAECLALQRATVAREARPYQRQGLLIGIVPVLLAGGLLYWFSRR